MAVWMNWMLLDLDFVVFFMKNKISEELPHQNLCKYEYFIELALNHHVKYQKISTIIHSILKSSTKITLKTQDPENLIQKSNMR